MLIPKISRPIQRLYFSEKSNYNIKAQCFLHPSGKWVPGMGRCYVCVQNN